MIKPSAILILVALFVVLTLGYLMLPSDRPQAQALKNTGETLFKDFKFETVKKVEIKKGAVTVVLEKKDEKWVLTSHKDRPGKSERIEQQLLEDIKKARIEETRTGKEKTFGLDETERTEIIVHNDSDKAKLFVGSSLGGGKTFVRTQSDGPIFEMDKALDTDAGIRTEKDARILDPAYFYDLKILAFNSDDVIDIVVKKGHAVTRVQKSIPGKGPLQPKQEIAKDEKPVWWLTEPEGGEADEGSVKTICSNLSALNAKSYADEIAEKDRGLDAPAAKVLVRLKDGTEHTLIFGRQEGDDVIASVSGKADVFKLYKYVLDTVTKDLKKKDETQAAGSAEPSDAIPPVAPIQDPALIPAQPKADPVVPRKTGIVPPPPPPPPASKETPAPAQPPAVVK